MQADHLEPNGCGRGPCSHGERADETPTLPLPELREGCAAILILDVKVVYGPRPTDGRVLIETPEGNRLIVDRWTLTAR